MKMYKVYTVELHVVKKTVYVEAKNKTQARSKVKDHDWYDAEPDEYTGDVDRTIIKNIEEIDNE